MPSGNSANSYANPNPPQKKNENLTLLEAQRQRNLGNYYLISYITKEFFDSFKKIKNILSIAISRRKIEMNMSQVAKSINK